jgi:hypothetical protein
MYKIPGEGTDLPIQVAAVKVYTVGTFNLCTDMDLEMKIIKFIFLKIKFPPMLIEVPHDKNVGGNEVEAPRILNLDTAVELLVSNGQQAG